MEKLQGFLLTMGLLVLITFVWHRMNRPKGSRQFRTGHATVVSRRVDQKQPDFRGLTAWKYLVTFDLGSTRVELQTSEEEYRRLTEGLTGHLEWRYEYLVSFTPDDYL